MIRYPAIVFSILVLFSFGQICFADGNRLVPLGEHCYRIPEWNARPINFSPFWPGTMERSSTRSLTLQFSSKEVARSIPGYQTLEAGRPEARLIVGLFVPTAEERATQVTNRKRAHYDIWYALGDYAARTLEPIPGTGYHRVYPLAGGNSWMVVTRIPDTRRRDTHLRDDFWIATCHYAGEERTRRCSTNAFVGRLHLDFGIVEAHLPHREQLAQYFVEKLQAWQAPCEGQAP